MASPGTRSTVAVVVVLAVAGLAAFLLLREDVLDDEPDRAPLTGEPVDEAIEHGIVATKVDNAPPARPQVGLEQADIVFEVLAEGGITRFVALFHRSVPADVGPVRSARLVDVDLLPAYDPLLAISGAREEVLDALEGRVEFVTESGPPAFTRSDDRPSPHDLFLHPVALLDAEGAPSPPDDVVWDFDEVVPEGGSATDELTVELSPAATTTWRRQGEAGTYQRLQNGEPHEGVAADNVVVLGVEVEARDELTLTRIVDEGDAVVLRDGQRFEVRWRKAALDEHIELLGEDDEALPLRPGRTWVLLAPAESLPDA